MRIKKINLLLKDVKDVGLKPFNTDRFGSVIALVGKNGSGKTRFLNLLVGNIRKSSLAEVGNNNFDELPIGIKRYIQQQEYLLSYVKLLNLKKEIENIHFERKINPANQELVKMLNDVQNKLNKEKEVFRIDNSIRSKINRFNSEITKSFNQIVKVISPDNLRNLKSALDGDANRFRDAINRNQNISELDMLYENSLAYIESLPKLLQEAKASSDLKKVPYINNGHFLNFKTLKELIETFLEKEFSWDVEITGTKIEGEENLMSYKAFWTLDGKKMNYDIFSEGEKALFTYALLFYFQSQNKNTSIKFNEWIIIIDEPELNLHPKAQVRLIDRLSELTKDKGQLIIATHSIPILASLDYSSIYLVRRDKIIHPQSKVPFEALNDLMGMDEYYYKMLEFLKSPSLWAMTNYMTQCFKSADVFEFADETDPQVRLFKNHVLKKKGLNILDYGCGKGRLLSSIKEDENIWNRIKLYDTFDINPDNESILRSKGSDNFFSSLSDIPKNKYHLIVLINVLHEISIELWSNVLNTLNKCLSKTGQLVFIEDTKMPVGELPSKEGFFLLGKDEFKTLYGEKNILFANKDKDRMLCAIASKSKIKDVIITDKIIIKTLEKLKSNSFEALKELRNIPKEEQESKHISLGRTFGLKSNLYINSQLAINKLTETLKTK